MINLHYRSQAKELIDGPHGDAAALRQTYDQIKSINVCTLGYWPIMSAVKHFLTRYGHDYKIKILDIGCGNGEMLRRIDDYARLKNFSVELTGIDLNREAISAAVELSASGINYIHGDIFVDGMGTYDLIINSLVMHHLTDDEIVKLMQWMGSHARIGWYIGDLHRHALAYYFIKYFVKLRRFNHLVCHDAPLSVARSFRREEWAGLLARAKFNLDSIKVSWYPNFRYGVRYEKFLTLHAGS